MYSTNMSTVTLREFQKFLLVEQNDPMGNDEEKVCQFMRDYLHQPNRTSSELFFTQSQFLEMLYSKRNSIWDSKHDQVTQDMNRPLSHYWISTSHNTFLKGDNSSSALSLDAYVRCLRTGCRCVDLECWDGPFGVPVICYGHTLTPRLNLLDVLNTIKENAFATSDYPLILSIESNCSIAQQRNLAHALLRVFGDLLHTNHLSDKKDATISTPSLLRRKILLNHRTTGPQPQLQEEDNAQADEDGPLRLEASKKYGVLYMENLSDNQNPEPIPFLSEWNAHMVNITFGRMLYYEQCTKTEIDSFGDNKDMVLEISVEVIQDGTHFGESWFHGKLDGNREEAERLLLDHSYLGDGTFLVRESNTFTGDYCLSFLAEGSISHCRIQQKIEGRTTKYFYDDQLPFNSLYELVTYYRRNPIYTEKCSVILKVSVPRLNKHEKKGWYHPNTSREQAERILEDFLTNGTFLVRPGERDRNSFVITFRYNKEEVNHCKILVESRMYTIGTVLFESLVGLVEFYRLFYIHHKTRLTEPIKYIKRITANSLFAFEAQDKNDLTFKAGDIIMNVSRCNQNWWRGDCGEKRQGWFPANRVQLVKQSWLPKKKSSIRDNDYIEPKFFSSEITAEALYQYKAQEKNDLSFSRGAIITNVDKRDPTWWRGDYGGKHYGSFPANYVKEIIRAKVSRKEKNDDTTLQTGSIDVTNAVVGLVEGIDAGVPRWVIQIQTPSMCSPFEMAAPTHKIALEWLDAIYEEGESSNPSIRAHGIAKPVYSVHIDMPDHTVYCSSFAFNKARIGGKGFTFEGMSSFSGTKAANVIRQQDNTVVFKYHRNQFYCVNPIEFKKIGPSNFNPMPFWTAGSQMVALNYHLGDKPMQMNRAKFRENGGCGYILKPDFMFEDDYNPTLQKIEKTKRLSVMLRVIGARHLSVLDRSIVSPFVEVEIIGADHDNGIKLVTKAIANDDLKLTWNRINEFEVYDPEVALIRFHVQDKNPTDARKFLGQATFPLKCLRTGYRSVPICNSFSEESVLATLLVHLTLTHLKF